MLVTLGALFPITSFNPIQRSRCLIFYWPMARPMKAIAVLAEWLTHWTDKKRAIQEGQERPDVHADSREIISNPELYLPEWFKFRVAARIALLLSDLGGQDNRAFRDFMGYYATGLAKYISESSQGTSLLRLNDVCNSWGVPDRTQLSTAEGVQKKYRTDMERKIGWLLLSSESDYLRTDANFLSEEDSIEALDALRRRASLLASTKAECLPLSGQFSDPEFRVASVGSLRITAGLVTLAVAERISSLAKSTGDRNRSEEIHRQGEAWLRDGWGDLKPAISREREELMTRPWSDRVFAQSILGGLSDVDKNAFALAGRRGSNSLYARTERFRAVLWYGQGWWQWSG